MNIEKEIKSIKERNARVEADKAWETSLFRKICILIVTYFLAWLLMVITGTPKPYLNALVPTLGFFLSTLTLGFAKSLWLKKIYKN